MPRRRITLMALLAFSAFILVPTLLVRRATPSRPATAQDNRSPDLLTGPKAEEAQTSRLQGPGSIDRAVYSRKSDSSNATDTSAPTSRPMFQEANASRRDEKRTAKHAPVTADEILQRMREAYSALTSYYDRGHVVRAGFPNGVTYDHPFRTFFKRPLHYRFEWLAEMEPWRSSCWAIDGKAYFAGADKVPHKVANLSSACLAIGSFYGSGPHAVLKLLDSDAAPVFPDLIVPGSRMGDEIVDGVDCYHLSGIFPVNGWRKEVWIGKTDFLLRKTTTILPPTFSSKVKLPRSNIYDTVTVLYLDVTIDLELPDELFIPPNARPD